MPCSPFRIGRPKKIWWVSLCLCYRKECSIVLACGNSNAFPVHRRILIRVFVEPLYLGQTWRRQFKIHQVPMFEHCVNTFDWPMVHGRQLYQKRGIWLAIYAAKMLAWFSLLFHNGARLPVFISQVDSLLPIADKCFVVLPPPSALWPV